LLTLNLTHMDEYYCLCALDTVNDLLTRKWMLLVVNSIGNKGRARFSQIYRELTGISPTTLASILRNLESKGLITRTVFAEVPPRVEYSLTKDGEGLRHALLPLLKWASMRDEYAKIAQQCGPEKLLKVHFTNK
jgi:DNA-binding HxlR family transcriptional regulator